MRGAVGEIAVAGAKMIATSSTGTAKSPCGPLQFLSSKSLAQVNNIDRCGSGMLIPIESASSSLMSFLVMMFNGYFAEGRAGVNGEIAVAETLGSTRRWDQRRNRRGKIDRVGRGSVR